MYSEVSQKAVVGPSVRTYSAHTASPEITAHPHTGRLPTRSLSIPIIRPCQETGFRMRRESVTASPSRGSAKAGEANAESGSWPNAGRYDVDGPVAHIHLSKI